MLILTRRAGEALKIGPDVSVTVLGIKGNQVRLGINAPREIGVFREELVLRLNESEPAVALAAAAVTAAGN